MSYFLVMIKGDSEEYHFYNQEDAENFIKESSSEGEWVEIISLDSLNPDLI
jgi:hypothetical protein